jgi:hypothetical protein
VPADLSDMSTMIASALTIVKQGGANAGPAGVEQTKPYR